MIVNGIFWYMILNGIHCTWKCIKGRKKGNLNSDKYPGQANQTVQVTKYIHVYVVAFLTVDHFTSLSMLQIKGNAEFFEGAPSTGDVLSHLGKFGGPFIDSLVPFVDTWHIYKSLGSYRLRYLVTNLSMLVS